MAYLHKISKVEVEVEYYAHTLLLRRLSQALDSEDAQELLPAASCLAAAAFAPKTPANAV